MTNSSKITTFFLTLAPEAKGKEFERYCKWFLENDPRYAIQIKKVWLWKDWPENWGRDKGIDLIAETHQGQIWAIQAKAYDQTKDYYITKEDVDKFLSESSRKEISFRLLMATTNNIGPNALEVMAAQEKSVGLCLLDKLDASVLNFSDFLNDSMTGSRKESRVPRSHQKEALQAIILGFQYSPRGQVHMACGTGKTLTGLWLAEQLQSKITLVLVPSISLVAQLYEQWASHCSENSRFHPFFVCSDQTVYDKDDDEKNSAEEITNLGFPVTTDSRELLKELSATAGTKVIFSTYHSSGVIQELCSLDTTFNFDLVIADEAHRCAGKGNSEFSTIVNSDDIRAHRKLFMTATPKLFSAHVKNKAKEFECEIVSMDDESIFGPVFYKLPFSKAIQKKLLSDYRVIISVMDDATYRDYAEKGRFVFFENYETDARTLASQLLVAKVIQKLDLKKVISFHNRTKSAKHFIQTFSSSLALLPDEERPNVPFQKTIFGEMPQLERHRILKQFSESVGTALLANVKCLSEGVDVPILDGIAFIDPRGSEIDIIQAVGRAIRKAPKKKIGTIIIPIFIDGTSNESEIFEKSCFKPIWQVVRALRSHDDTLAEELDTIRLELGKRPYKPVAKFSKITIDLPIEIGIEFGQALKIKLIENIIQRCSPSWDYQFAMLKKFREIYPTRWPLYKEEFPLGNKLGRWCSIQRSDYRKKMLSDEKINELEAIGFPWNKFTHSWHKQFNFLKEYRFMNPNRWPRDDEQFPTGNKLGVWYAAQQHRFKNNKLKDWQVELLTSIGFIGDVFNSRWNQQYEYLKEYRVQNPFAWPKGNEEFPEVNNIAAWCHDQRDKYRNNTLEPDRIKKLNLIGFPWDPLNDDWMQQFNFLKEYRNLFPNKWPKTKEQYPHGNELGRWCSRQRQYYRDGSFINESYKIEMLNSIGFEWNKFDAKWNKQFDILKDFRAKFPNRWPMQREEFPKGNKLGQWLSGQIKNFRKGKLDKDKRRALEDLGFEFKEVC